MPLPINARATQNWTATPLSPNEINEISSFLISEYSKTTAGPLVKKAFNSDFGALSSTSISNSRKLVALLNDIRAHAPTYDFVKFILDNYEASATASASSQDTAAKLILDMTAAFNTYKTTVFQTSLSIELKKRLDVVVAAFDFKDIATDFPKLDSESEPNTVHSFEGLEKTVDKVVASIAAGKLTIAGVPGFVEKSAFDAALKTEMDNEFSTANLNNSALTPSSTMFHVLESISKKIQTSASAYNIPPQVALRLAKQLLAKSNPIPSDLDALFPGLSAILKPIEKFGTIQISSLGHDKDHNDNPTKMSLTIEWVVSGVHYSILSVDGVANPLIDVVEILSPAQLAWKHIIDKVHAATPLINNLRVSEIIGKINGINSEDDFLAMRGDNKYHTLTIDQVNDLMGRSLFSTNAINAAVALQHPKAHVTVEWRYKINSDGSVVFSPIVKNNGDNTDTEPSTPTNLNNSIIVINIASTTEYIKSELSKEFATNRITINLWDKQLEGFSTGANPDQWFINKIFGRFMSDIDTRLSLEGLDMTKYVPTFTINKSGDQYILHIQYTFQRADGQQDVSELTQQITVRSVQQELDVNEAKLHSLHGIPGGLFDAGVHPHSEDGTRPKPSEADISRDTDGDAAGYIGRIQTREGESIDWSSPRLVDDGNGGTGWGITFSNKIEWSSIFAPLGSPSHLTKTYDVYLEYRAASQEQKDRAIDEVNMARDTFKTMTDDLPGLDESKDAVKQELDSIASTFEKLVNSSPTMSEKSLNIAKNQAITDMKLKFDLYKDKDSSQDIIKELEKIFGGNVPQSVIDAALSKPDVISELLEMTKDPEIIKEIANNKELMEQLSKYTDSEMFQKMIQAVIKVYHNYSYAYFGIGVGAGAAGLLSGAAAVSSARSQRNLAKIQNGKTKIKGSKIIFTITTFVSLLLMGTSAGMLVWFFVEKGGF